MGALQTFQSIVGDVHSHSLGVDSALVEGWVRDVWDEIQRIKTWSHMRRQMQIVIPTPYEGSSTGASYTAGSNTVVINSPYVVSQSHVGRQLQRAVGYPIYDIVAVDTGANTYTVFPAYNEADGTVTSGFRVLTAYISVPSDFFCWLNVRDTMRRRRLNHLLSQEEIDRYDPQRSIGDRPAGLAGIDWTRTYAGRVYSTQQVVGSGPAPIAGGSYNGQYDALLIIKITTGGVVDTAQFSWAIDSGTPVVTTVSSAGNSLPCGVDLVWNAGTYVLSNVFVVRLSAKPIIGLPRYELYPHPREAMVLTALYSTGPSDPEDPDWAVPLPITGSIIGLGAKGEMARYPGTREKPNPYAQIGRATALRERYEAAVAQAMTMDDYIIEQNVFQMEDSWPMASLPWVRNQTDDISQLFFA